MKVTTMSKDGNESIKKFDNLKYLFDIAILFTLLPPYSTRKKTLILYKIRSIIVFLFFVIFYILTAIHQITIYVNKELVITLTSFLLYFISNTFLLAAVLSANISSFWNLKDSQVFIKILKDIDTCLKMEPKTQREKKIFLITFIMVHVILIAFVIMDLYTMYVVFGNEIIFLGMVSNIQEFLVSLSMLLIYNCTKCFKIRYKKLKTLLKQNVEMITKNLSGKPINFNNTYRSTNIAPADIKKIRSVFGKMYGLISLFNKMFGWTILLTVGLIAADILALINIQMTTEIEIENRIYFFLNDIVWMVWHGVSTYIILIY